MLFLWIVAGAGLLVALASFAATRRVRKKLDDLNHSYWELRYEYTKLRAQVQRLDPEHQEAAPPEPAPATQQVAFVPLSSLRPPRKEP